jgi:transposase
LVNLGGRRQPRPCPFGGLHTGPSPVDRARSGSKHHLITDSNGIPLAISLTGGNRNDVTQLLPLVDGVGPVTGKPGRPRRRAERVLADRGYDHDKYRRECRRRGVKPVIARRSTVHGSGLGKERWVVERTFAWLHNLRRLRIRYERDPELHMAFMLLGCAVVCQRRLSA